MSVILLDLNFTLVTNSIVKVRPFLKQIEGEKYSADLIAKINGSTVVLITARPARYEQETMDSIKQKTGWVPDEAYFNDLSLPPQNIKRSILKRFLLDRYRAEDMIGIESNPKTRAMYAEHGIKSQTIKEFMGG